MTHGQVWVDCALFCPQAQVSASHAHSGSISYEANMKVNFCFAF